MVTQEKLIIYLHANDLDHPSWAVLDETGAIRQCADHDEVVGLAQIAIDKEVIVLVPAEEVVLLTTKLPKMNRARLSKAVPYALEDQLIAEVESLHFALGQYNADMDLPVAVVAHEKMQQWLSLLKSWQIDADQLVPSLLTMPLEDESWQVLIAELAIVRTGKFSGFTCEINNLSSYIALFLASNASPQKIYYHHLNHEFKSSVVVDPKIVEEQLTHTNIFTVMKDFSATINLLQGDYAVKKAKFQMKKIAKLNLYFASSFLFLLFLYPTISYMMLSHHINKIDEQIAAIYHQQFPQATTIVAPKLRLQEKLKKILVKNGENHLLLLLGYVGKSLAEVHQITLNRLDYQREQLNLQISASNADDLSTFIHLLSKDGLIVKQQEANFSGSQLQANLQIE